MSLKSKPTVTLLDFKSTTLKQTEEIDKFFQRQLRQATRAWLRAVLLKVPEYSGAARGSFKPLGRVLRVAVPPGVKGGTTDPKKKLPYGRNIKGKMYPTTSEGGEAYGTDFDFVYDDKNQEYKFRFNVELPYVLWNSIAPAPAWIKLAQPTPWYALQEGYKAFNHYLEFEMPTRKFYQALKDDIENFCVSSKVVKV